MRGTGLMQAARLRCHAALQLGGPHTGHLQVGRQRQRLPAARRRGCRQRCAREVDAAQAARSERHELQQQRLGQRRRRQAPAQRPQRLQPLRARCCAHVKEQQCWVLGPVLRRLWLPPHERLKHELTLIHAQLLQAVGLWGVRCACVPCCCRCCCRQLSKGQRPQRQVATWRGSSCARRSTRRACSRASAGRGCDVPPAAAAVAAAAACCCSACCLGGPCCRWLLRRQLQACCVVAAAPHGCCCGALAVQDDG
jgi:hypothetical protein